MKCCKQGAMARHSKTDYLFLQNGHAFSLLELVGFFLLELHSRPVFKKDGEFPVNRSVRGVALEIIRKYCTEKGFPDMSRDKSVSVPLLNWLDTHVLFRTRKCFTGEGLSYYELFPLGARLLDAALAVKDNRSL
jgi:hypothetical protein